MSVVLTFLINTIFNLIVGLIVAKFLGPAEYGKFALAVAVMAFGQALAFEWIRQCGVRFYSERTRLEAPSMSAPRSTPPSRLALLFFPIALALAFFGPAIRLAARPRRAGFRRLDRQRPVRLSTPLWCARGSTTGSTCG